MDLQWESGYLYAVDRRQNPAYGLLKLCREMLADVSSYPANHESDGDNSSATAVPDFIRQKFVATPRTSNNLTAAFDGAMASEVAPNGAVSASQVKIQLSSRDPDLKLPEETGPILVSTSTYTHASLQVQPC